MKVGVFLVLFRQRPFEEALDFVKQAGVGAVEIGSGGYVGDAHCKPAELLGGRRGAQGIPARRSPAATWRSAPSPATATRSTPTRRSAARHDAVFRDTIRLAGELGVGTVITFSGCPGDSDEAEAPELGDLPLAAGLHRDAGVAVDGEGRALLVRGGGVRQGARRAGRDRAASRLRRLPHRDRSGGCARSAARRSASTSIPRTSSGRGWTRSSACASLGAAIFHVHMKDTWLDQPNIRRNGVLDTKPYTDEKDRSWIFRTVGYGHGQEFWRALISELRLAGYDGALSIEHEDSHPERQRGLHPRRRVPQHQTRCADRKQTGGSSRRVVRGGLVNRP